MLYANTVGIMSPVKFAIVQAKIESRLACDTETICPAGAVTLAKRTLILSTASNGNCKYSKKVYLFLSVSTAAVLNQALLIPSNSAHVHVEEE